MAAVVRTVKGGIVEIRADRTVDRDTRFAQQPRGLRAETVAPCAINARQRAEAFFDLVAQFAVLGLFEVGGEVARIAVVRADLLAEGRIDPWVQLDPDLCLPRTDRVTDDIARQRVVGDRPVDQIDRRHLQPFAEFLKTRDRAHVVEAIAIGAEGGVPVELFFGIHGQQRPGTEALGKGHLLGRFGWDEEIGVGDLRNPSRPRDRAHRQG